MSAFKSWRAAIVATLLACAAPSRAESPDAVTRAMQAVLDRQIAAWNRGDLEGYLEGYWRSPSLTFAGGGEITVGFDGMAERYRKRYRGTPEAMGKLVMSDLYGEALGPASGWMRGTWRLTFADGKQRYGVFTIILRRLKEGWRVVHDHSSVAP